jgi:cell fate (sporulation/competence/biofilm development) regulator YlbF (YheA/YmcA/DUF963 family)
MTIEKGEKMIYSRLIKLIEDNAAELTDRVYKELLAREETSSFKGLAEDAVRDRIYDVYSRLDSWLGRKSRTGEVQQSYIQLGKKSVKEGIPLHELVMYLMLVKRHLWLYVRENQFFESTYECYQALELNNKVVLFFDRAIFSVIIGYEEETGRTSGGEGIISRLLKKK